MGLPCLHATSHSLQSQGVLARDSFSASPPPCVQVAGTSGKVKLDGGSDDEGAACESYGTQILAALGPQRYATVLSKLYLARSDVQYVVRNTGLHM